MEHSIAKIKITNLANLTLITAISFGLISVFTSTSYISRFPHTAIILPWQFPFWAIIPFLVTGMMFFLYILQKPLMFWPVLVGATVLTSGIFVLRFPIFDAWLAGMIVLGGIVSIINGSIPRKQLQQRDWVLLFFIFLLHLFILSIIGLFVYDNIKAIRFSIIFSIIIAILYMVAQYDFPRLNHSQITRLIAYMGLFYYLLYLVHGLVFYQYVYTRGIWAGIGGFVGAGAQTVINIVAAPAAFILIFQEKGKHKFLGWTVLVLAIIVTSLADARGGMLAILLATLGVFFTYGFSRTIKVFLFVGVITVIIGTVFFGRTQRIFELSEDIFSSVNIARGHQVYEYYGRHVHAGKGDAGRFLLVRSGIEALLNENPFQSIFGSGTYGYYPVAGSYFKSVASEYGIEDTFPTSGAFGKEPPRPPALGAMIVEAGFLGLALILLCLAVVIRVTMFGTGLSLRRNNILIAIPLFSAMLWTYFGESQNIIMFYLLIMPYGIIHTWGEQVTTCNNHNS